MGLKHNLKFECSINPIMGIFMSCKTGFQYHIIVFQMPNWKKLSIIKTGHSKEKKEVEQTNMNTELHGCWLSAHCPQFGQNITDLDERFKCWKTEWGTYFGIL